MYIVAYFKVTNRIFESLDCTEETKQVVRDGIQADAGEIEVDIVEMTKAEYDLLMSQ